MNKDYMNGKIKEYLSLKLGCDTEMFNKEGMNIIKNNRSSRIKMMLINNTIIVSVPEKLYDLVRESLDGKSTYEIFEFPYVYGQSIYYVPDMEKIERVDEPDSFRYRMFDKDMEEINISFGFENAISFNEGKCTSEIAYCAYDGDRIIGIAGADKVNDNIWEVGIEVLPEYRGLGLATALSNNLTLKILEKGIVPIWCASSTNIGSQAVACRSGYIPFWYESYGDVFDDGFKYKDLINMK